MLGCGEGFKVGLLACSRVGSNEGLAEGSEVG